MEILPWRRVVDEFKQTFHTRACDESVGLFGKNLLRVPLVMLETASDALAAVVYGSGRDFEIITRTEFIEFLKICIAECFFVLFSISPLSFSSYG